MSSNHKAEIPQDAFDRVCRTQTPARLSDKDIAILRDTAIQLHRANDALRADNEILRVAEEERRLENKKTHKDYDNLEQHMRRESQIAKEQQTKIRELEAKLRGDKGLPEWEQRLLSNATAAAVAEGHRQDLARLESQMKRLLEHKRISKVLVLEWTARLRTMRENAKRTSSAWGRWQELKGREAAGERLCSSTENRLYEELRTAQNDEEAAIQVAKAHYTELYHHMDLGN
ncbi:hypothetical protein KJ359_007589 [Pestalotiopsis sp. 9143b]|nr:hypothetical protein KJ359_007589 [Pestalotiopsis sp. 9143b]